MFIRFLLLFSISINLLAYETGLIKKTYNNPEKKKLFYTNIYYPTSSKMNFSLIGDNPVFLGIKVKENSQIADSKFPLIILVHGSGGNNTNLNYLVEALVSKGIIVVAANYPGSTTGDSNPAETVRVWIQNEDVTFLLDQILKDEQINNNILKNSIGIMGHSKGAYTSIAKVGGRLELNKFINYCTINLQMPDCIFYKSGNVDLNTLDKKKFEKSYVDKRFSYAIAIDPGFGASFDGKSLENIDVPVLLILADYYSPKNTKENLLGDNIYVSLNKKKSVYKKIIDSGHFSFLSECKKDALEILAEEGEDEMLICQDGEKSRNDIHKETIESVFQFLNEIDVIR